MSDNSDWEAKYWQQRMKQIQQAKNSPESLPHYEPAHIFQHRARGANHELTGQWQDVDPVTAMYTNMQGLVARGMGPQVQTVMIKSGINYYKSVQAEGFGNTMPLVKKCGPYYDNVGREFEMMQECRCYVIDNLQTVDLGNIDPKRLVSLVQVRAPFIGTILVERTAIVATSNRGPQVLKG